MPTPGMSRGYTANQAPNIEGLLPQVGIEPTNTHIAGGEPYLPSALFPLGKGWSVGEHAGSWGGLLPLSLCRLT